MSEKKDACMWKEKLPRGKWKVNAKNTLYLYKIIYITYINMLFICTFIFSFIVNTITLEVGKYMHSYKLYICWLTWR